MGRNIKVLIAVQDSILNGAIKSCTSNSKLEYVYKSEFEEIINAFNSTEFTSIIIENCFLEKKEFITAINTHLATNDVMPNLFGVSPNNEHIELNTKGDINFHQVLTMCIGHNLAAQLESASELYNLRNENKLLEKQRNEAQQKVVYLQTNNDDVISQELEKVEKQREEIDKLNYSKSYYIARKSHALRNILHGILSFANIGEMKCETSSPEKMKSFFNYISESGHKLEHILEQLVYLSKLECNRVETEIIDHNIYKAIKQSIDNQNDLLAEKNITVDIQMLLDNLRFAFDKEMIVSAFDKIICNAATYSDNNKKIDISFEETTLENEVSALNIIVKDEGNGFNQPLDTVFQKYYVNESKDKMSAESGLGLAICKEIIKKHNGTIGILNSSETGSTIAITLPLEQPKPAPKADATVTAFALSFDEEFSDYSSEIEAALTTEVPIGDQEEKTDLISVQEDIVEKAIEQTDNTTESSSDEYDNVELF